MAEARLPSRRPRLRGGDLLGAGALRALADLERDAVALAQRIERRARACGLMEELLRAVGHDDEAEAARPAPPLRLVRRITA